MQVLHFQTSDSSGKDQFKKFTENSRYVIERVHTTFVEPHFYTSVYYTESEQVTNTELDVLAVNKVTAALIMDDERYLSCKNNDARELFLLSNFGVNSAQAAKIIALVGMMKAGAIKV